MQKHRFIVWGGVFLGVLFLYGCSASMKADMALRQKNYPEAITLYENYLAQNPADTKARSKLGFAYLKTGQLDKAQTTLETALKESPDDPPTILYLGLTYLNQEKIDQAIVTWQGYRNRKQPLVEEEINRQLTVLLIVQSQREAQKALAQEEQLKTVKPKANTVAVSYYQDLSPDKSLRAFQKALTAMVISDLSKVKSLTVVERVRLQALLQEMKLGQTGIVDPKTAPRIGHLLGVENMIVGNLSLGSIKAVTTLQGNKKGSAAATVGQEQFYELPGIIVQNVTGIMGTKLTDAEKKAIGIPHTTVYDAMIHYGEGLDAIDGGKWEDARNFFNMALQLDPKFRLAEEMRDGTPNPDAPGIMSLKSMPFQQLSTNVENSVNTAEAAQAEADKKAEEMEGGDGGSGGGGHG